MLVNVFSFCTHKKVGEKQLDPAFFRRSAWVYDLSLTLLDESALGG